MQEYRWNVVQPNGTAQPFFEGKRMFLWSNDYFQILLSFPDPQEIEIEA